MAEITHCIREKDLSALRADVHVLLRDSIADDRRLEKLENKLDELSTISTAISVMSLSLEHIVEHNNRQDEMMKSQNRTLELMNENLNRLNQGQECLEEEVGILKARVDNNENLTNIDIRELNKRRKENYLNKYAGPMAVGMGAGALLLEIIKAFL